MDQEINTSSKIWEKMMNFSKQAPEYAKHMGPLMGSLDGLLKTKDHKEAFSHIMEMLTHVNDHQLKKAKGSATPVVSKTPATHTLTGNHFFDLFNSPGMKDIVKEVMTAKHGRRKKKK